MNNKGQSLVEMAIIFAIVAIAGIVVLTALGKNVNTMYKKSNEEAAKYKPFEYGSTSGSSQAYSDPVTNPVTNPVTEAATNPGNAKTINGVPVNFNTDGSAAFTYKGQDIYLSSAVMSDLNIVFDTAGSEGMKTEVMAAIQKMIDAHGSKYPAGGMPLKISFGKGERNQSDKENEAGGLYAGDTSINMLSVSVGDYFIMMQKDKLCPNGQTPCGKISSVDGKMLSGTNFEGKVSSPYSSVNGSTYYGQLVGNSFSGGVAGNSTSGGASWTFDFTGSSYNLPTG